MATGSVLQAQPSGPANKAVAPQQHHDANHAHAALAGRLVYAKPQDLPSFPSLGLAENGSAASAAASLGWANQQSPEPWRPDKTASASAAASLGWANQQSPEPWKPSKSASASAAAVLAKDYKMNPLWQPTESNDGARAAILAAAAARTSEAWKPVPTEHGFTAATEAFKAGRNANRGAPVEPLSNHGSLLAAKGAMGARNQQTESPDHHGSLLAAKGAMGNRQRAQTAPTQRETYPDEANAANNALRAATRAHQPRNDIPLEEAGAIPYTTMNRQMFTSKPPVKPEVDEQRRAESLHASAVVMAKKMYEQQQKVIDAAKQAHVDGDSKGRGRSSSSGAEDVPAMPFNTLQDAAYRQAQERLAKIHEDNLKSREYQEYYGSRSSRRFSIREKLRRRSSSDGDINEDHLRSREIRQQMSIFSSKLSQVDQKKRQHDRDALLATAQRNVQARLKGMDEKISAEGGHAAPNLLSQWELKAHAAAQARSNERMGNHGKVDIGAGKFMSQSEIDAIAASRVQPVLDDINDKAERERARQTELRLEAERKKEEEETQKAREREVKEINRKLREQEKQEQREKREAEKLEARSKKEEEKAIKAEQRRMSKSEKRKSAADKPDEDVQPAYEADEEAAIEPKAEPENGTIAMNSSGQPVNVPSAETANDDQEDVEEERNINDVKLDSARRRKSLSNPLPTDKVKNWLKSRFSKSSKSGEDDKPREKHRRSFVGGAALSSGDGNASTTSIGNGSASVRAVAMAGRSSDNRRPDVSQEHMDGIAGSSAVVSPISSESENEYFRDEPREGDDGLSAPPRLKDPTKRTSQSPMRDSRFHEDI